MTLFSRNANDLRIREEDRFEYAENAGAKKERPETQSRRPVSFESPDLSMNMLMALLVAFQQKKEKNFKITSNQI